MKFYIKNSLNLIMLFGVFLQAGAQVKIDRTKEPEPGPPPILKITKPVIYRMKNGITVLIVEDHRLPKISASYYIDAGPILEGKKAGAGALLGLVLNEGTATMNKVQFDESFEKLGAYMRLSFSGGDMTSLTRYFNQAFKLMIQALRNPAFSESSFQNLKEKYLNSFRSNSKNIRTIAVRVNNALTYGQGHPVGEFETEETIQNLTLQDIRNTYNSYISPSRGYLTIIGDVTLLNAKKLADSVLGDWQGRKINKTDLKNVPDPEHTEIDLIDVPEAVQSQISVINLENLKQSNSDYFAALLANYILGGGPQSRLFMNLREKHGFTYGSYSDLGSNSYQSTFDAAASVRNDKTDSTIIEVLNEIKRITTEKVTEQELLMAKKLYNGYFALIQEDRSRTASNAANILINGLKSDFYISYLQKINDVTANDILAAARKYIKFDHLRIIVVGNVRQIGEPLKRLGYQIKDYDSNAAFISAQIKWRY